MSLENGYLSEIGKSESGVQNFLDEIKESILHFLKLPEDDKNDLHLMIQLHPGIKKINDWYVLQLQSLIIKNVLAQRGIKSSKLKQIIAQKINEKFTSKEMKPFDEIIGKFMGNVYNRAMGSTGERLDFVEAEDFMNNLYDGEFIEDVIKKYKEILGIQKFEEIYQNKIIWKLIKNQNIISDQNIISISDVFNDWNNLSNKEKNMYEEITDEQVYAKYRWLKEIFEIIDLDENFKTQVLSAYKYGIGRINILKNDIRSELNKHSSVGYSVLNRISSISDNDKFVVVHGDSNSFPKLNCTLESNKRKWNFVLDFGYGRWGAELSDICFDDNVKVSDELQVLDDFKNYIKNIVEKRERNKY